LGVNPLIAQRQDKVEAFIDQPKQCLGDALAALGRELGLTNEDFEAFEQLRDMTPAEPRCFD